jgi:uncharacterized protein (UPF0335 family)
MSSDIEQTEGIDADSEAHRMLRLYINRIERLDDEIADLRADRKDVVAEAKASGFDPGALREVIKRRKADPQKLAELDAIVETYEIALGGVPRGTIWGGELRPQQQALPAPTTTQRSKKADDALALVQSAARAERE